MGNSGDHWAFAPHIMKMTKVDVQRGNAGGLQILLQERQTILGSQETTSRQKERFLAENRKALTIASGGRVTRTDEVVKWVLIL